MKILSNVMENVIKRNPNEPEFHQAVREVLESLEPVAAKHPEWVKAGSGQSWFPCGIQQRHRALQRRYQAASVCLFRYNQVSRI